MPGGLNLVTYPSESSIDNINQFDYDSLLKLIHTRCERSIAENQEYTNKKIEEDRKAKEWKDMIAKKSDEIGDYFISLEEMSSNFYTEHSSDIMSFTYMIAGIEVEPTEFYRHQTYHSYSSIHHTFDDAKFIINDVLIKVMREIGLSRYRIERNFANIKMVTHLHNGSVKINILFK